MARLAARFSAAGHLCPAASAMALAVHPRRARAAPSASAPGRLATSILARGARAANRRRPTEGAPLESEPIN
eukprot:3433009-Pyramimonas_sp.AAC.1